MSLPHIEIGQPSEAPEQRNPLGWFLFAALAALMIIAQLGIYLNRTPSVKLVRAQIEEQLETQLGLTGLIPTQESSKEVLQQSLERDARRLQAKLADDPETTLLYAAVKTEAEEPIKPAELNALRVSKDPGYKAAYEIYSQPALETTRAKELAAKLPSKKFLYRLVAVHALEKGKVPDARKRIAGGAGLVKKTVALLAIIVAFFAGLAVIVGYLVTREGRKGQQGFPMGLLSPPDADRLAMRSAQVYVAFLGVGYFAAQLLYAAGKKNYSDIPLYFLIAGLIILLAKIPVGGKWISLRSLGIKRDNLKRDILWGVAAAMANVPILLLVGLVTMPLFKGLPAPEHPVTIELADASSPWMILQLVLTAAIFAPFIEEVMFRGTLFPAISSLLKKPIWGAVISSFTFAAIHPTGIPAWPLLATIGGMSCFLVYQTRSLVPSMVMHGVHNFATLVITVLLLR